MKNAEVQDQLRLPDGLAQSEQLSDLLAQLECYPPDMRVHDRLGIMRRGCRYPSDAPLYVYEAGDKLGDHLDIMGANVWIR